MELIQITENLRVKLEEYFNFDPHSKNNVYGYSFLIRLIHEVVVDYIKFSNQKFANNPELQIPDELEDDLLSASIS